MYAQTIVEGGAVLQSITGCFADDSNQKNENIAVVKAMSIDILAYKNDKPGVALSISLNKSIDQCGLIKADKQYYQNDQLVIITSSMDVNIVSFSGIAKQLKYQISQQFNLLDYLQQDEQFEIPFQKKITPTIAWCTIDEQTRLIIFTFQECQQTLKQLVFMSIRMTYPLQFNISTVMDTHNITGLITQIMIHDPLDKQYKGQKMLPQLGLFSMYMNKYFTFELQMCTNFKEFNGIKFCSDKIQLLNGPFSVQNVGDFSVVQNFSHQNSIFPLLIASIDQIQIVHNFNQIIQHKLVNSTMVRPLSILVLQDFIIIALDSGEIMKCVFDGSKITTMILKQHTRMPTVTTMAKMQHESQTFLYFGSQSVDSSIVIIKNDELAIVNKKFSQCIGAIQDFCLQTFNRLHISTSHGRDGSVISGRFGYMLKCVEAIKLKECWNFDQHNLDQRKLNSFEQNGFQYFIISKENRSKIYQFDGKQIIDVSNQADFVPYTNEMFLLTKTYEMKQFRATPSYIMFNDQKLLLQIKEVQIQFDIVIVLTVDNILSLFQMKNDRLSKICEKQLINPLSISAFVANDKLFILQAKENCEIKLYKLENNQLQKQGTQQSNLKIHSIACKFEEGLHIIACSQQQVYHTKTDLTLNNCQFEQICCRTAKCLTYSYNNQVFVKSQKSINFFSYKDNQVFLQPLLTKPLSNVMAAYPVVECFQEPQQSQEIPFQPFNPLPSIAFNKQNRYLKFQLLIITDDQIKTQSYVPEYDLAYGDEDPQLNNYLGVCKINISTGYTLRRYLMHRTPVKIQHCNEHHLIAILTEQYVGKAQIRFYNDQQNKEFSKIIPENVAITDMKFLTIQGEIYFAYSAFNDEEKMRTQLTVCKIGAKVEVCSQLTFPSFHPITMFQQFGDKVYCCIGSKMCIVPAQFPLEVSQSMEFDRILEQIVFTKGGIFGIKTGQLFKLDFNLQNYQENTKFLDLKLISTINQNIVCVSYDNKIYVLNQEMEQIADLQISQNATCLREQNGKVFLGTDNGAIIVICEQAANQFGLLQNEIISVCEQKGQFIYNSQTSGSIDADILKLFEQMAPPDRITIAQKMNTGVKELDELLSVMMLRIAE